MGMRWVEPGGHLGTARSEQPVPSLDQRSAKGEAPLRAVYRIQDTGCQTSGAHLRVLPSRCHCKVPIPGVTGDQWPRTRIERVILQGAVQILDELGVLQAAMKRIVVPDEAGTPAGWPRADPPQPHLANGAPLRGALPMTCLRVMPPLDWENDVGGRSLPSVPHGKTLER